jgi:nitric oxide reductase subunit B
MNRRLWIGLASVVLGCFALLGYFGGEIYRQAPPLPGRVVDPSGRVLFTREDILDGQQVWQSTGGQQLGSIWGHGAYVAPDWSADWLHREATALRERFAAAEPTPPSEERLVALGERVRRELRRNTYDRGTDVLTLGADRAAVYDVVARHYAGLFGDDPALTGLREAYAMPDAAVPDAARRAKLTTFFWWTSWACATEREPGGVTYTNNWPHEPLIGNVPSAANVLWSIVSVVVLLAAVGALVWYSAAKRREEAPLAPPPADPLDGAKLTPSMRATGLYAGAVALLFLVQIALGIVTAHYGVEGRGFYGFDLASILPYAVTRTWHVQLGVFWIATSFLAAGLFLAPLVGGREPRGQRIGVVALLVALVVVVAGSLTGEWRSIMQRMDLDTGFWFGHQGYEYVDLGRFWQLALIAGLGLWLFLMVRGLLPAFRAKIAAGDTEAGHSRHLLTLFAGSTIAIALFYAAGLFYGARTHLSVAEYWRWWVVHLWVEGFFEVFATAAIAFLFTKLGLVRPSSATRATIFATSIFLLGGIPGTLHHLYFAGTPVGVMALGATFSALEIVPLVLVGAEAVETLRLGRAAPWTAAYRPSIRCFVAVAFWNLVGAGVFGFLINPPIALYYVQGLNTTPVHGHTALMGVYGFLSLGLVLFVLRRLTAGRPWKTGALTFSFWALNIGLALMVLLSLLPIGLLQAQASIETGLWYARSAAFLQQDVFVVLRWLRAIGDAIFAAGGLAFGWFVLGLWRGWSYRPSPRDTDPNPAPEAARELPTPRRRRSGVEGDLPAGVR